MRWAHAVIVGFLFLAVGCTSQAPEQVIHPSKNRLSFQWLPSFRTPCTHHAEAASMTFRFLHLDTGPDAASAKLPPQEPAVAVVPLPEQTEKPKPEPLEVEVLGPKLDIRYSLEMLENAVGSWKNPLLRELVLDTYIENDLRPLFMDPHYDSAPVTAYLKLLVQAHELGFDPGEVHLEAILKHVTGPCRVTFPGEEPGLAPLEKRMSQWVETPTEPLVTLRCSAHWAPHEKRRLPLDVALIHSFYALQKTLSPSADADTLKARWRGPGQAVFQVLGRLPDNYRYFARVDALRKYLQYWGRGEFPVLEDHGRLRRGDVGPRVARLKRRLVIEGYLSDAGEGRSGKVFERKTRKAVRAYRGAYGMRTRSRVDSEMYEALKWDADVYASTLWNSLHSTLVNELERESGYVLVNIPAFTTTLVEDGRPVSSHRSVVGFPYSKRGGRTPKLASHIEYVDLNPEWTPTPYVVENELEQQASKDRGYWKKNHFVRRNNKWVQKPGPHNTLGQVVLGFPNENNISLHGTPEKHRFEYADRALSHGCIRVEGIEELGAALLKAEGIELDLAGVLARVEEKRVSLSTPVPIYLVYDRVRVLADGRISIPGDPYHLVAVESLEGRLAQVRQLVQEARRTRRLASGH